MRDLPLEDYPLLGLALVVAQRVEFALYGLASHIAHSPEGQKERRFRDLTPEKFLRGDPSELKATLGQLVEAFGDALFIRTPDLVTFYQDRNFIAHDYYRAFGMSVGGHPQRQGGREFLLKFIERAAFWEDILGGAIDFFKERAAEKFGRSAELNFTQADRERMRRYQEHAATHPRVKAHLESLVK
ncbi:hypothetical protein B6S44_19540 [Bosea sp. Tri-44]|uniref:hypothetical protein n=1 Tax=Bosea sp. Tri-44 TaxID=1972137 RepID=UPI00100DD168|nr:hypothetical protein [Bosea sp. Tri-44]RXT52935.1 hypothetical protein B6S44_19540 [Bosea sp. Tri-44]